MIEFNGVKVFSATMARERELLGETVTKWLREKPGIKIVDKLVTQSSDEAYHCIAITIFYNEATTTAAKPVPAVRSA